MADQGFKALSEKGRQYTLTTNSGKNISLNKLSSTVVSAGTGVVSAIVTTQSTNNIRKMNAYYDKVGKRPASEQNLSRLGFDVLSYGNRYKRKKK